LVSTSFAARPFTASRQLLSLNEKLAEGPLLFGFAKNKNGRAAKIKNICRLYFRVFYFTIIANSRYRTGIVLKS